MKSSMIEPRAVIERQRSSRDNGFAPVAEVLASQARIYALGKNQHTLKLLNAVNLTGVIDDFETSVNEWHGIPIVKGSDVPEGSVVINCSMSISPLVADERIRSIPGARVLPYAHLLADPGLNIELPDFVDDARRELHVNLEKYEHVFSLLQDEVSRDTFNRLLAYRLTADYSYMKGFSVRFREQYFEGFLGRLDGCVFADCGGYDGDTTEEFISRYPAYGSVLLIEPSEKNMERAKQRLCNARDIAFVPLGVSDAAEILTFNPDAGSASSISKEGSVTIQATTLDAFSDHKISFIKMDLEGWELKALQGAKRQIVENRPILAIAVYHSLADFWKIPEYIRSLSQEYRIYLRHYTQGWSETVMYFIPANVANTDS
jgi:FkbM family methyltransferase